jgi:MinD superfamily P-loop ATPase
VAREILIISGKGGTGKTSLTGAFAHLAEQPVITDLDVDAPDLHLLLKPQHEKTHDFISGRQAVVNPDLCVSCGLCLDYCRFGAVRLEDQGARIDPLKCEGCKVCVHFCPEGAIDFPQKQSGRWHWSQTRFGPMVHARLFPGEENSGRLVALLRQEAKARADRDGRNLILCDGAPGIGCPVISSLTGVSLAVIVTEPTPSGRHDLERVLDLCRHFRVPAGVIINKHDLNEDQARAIDTFCQAQDVPILARLPHDPVFTKAMVLGAVVTEMTGEEDMNRLLRRAWKAIEQRAGLDRPA